MESTRQGARASRRQQDWTRESEAAALAALRRAAESPGAKPVNLGYARQSKSDFDKDGKLRGPSIEQQFDSVERLSDVQGLPAEKFHDADRSGKETSRRPDYQRLIARIEHAAPGEIGAVEDRQRELGIIVGLRPGLWPYDGLTGALCHQPPTAFGAAWKT